MTTPQPQPRPMATEAQEPHTCQLCTHPLEGDEKDVHEGCYQAFKESEARAYMQAEARGSMAQEAFGLRA